MRHAIGTKKVCDRKGDQKNSQSHERIAQIQFSNQFGVFFVIHTKSLDVEFNGLELRGGKDMEGVTPVQTAVL